MSILSNVPAPYFLSMQSVSDRNIVIIHWIFTVDIKHTFYKGTGSPYKVTTMLLTALQITAILQDCGCSDLNCAINSTL